MLDAAALLDSLAHALLDEVRARGEVRAALARQAQFLRQLRDLGLPATRVAQRVAASRGVALGLADRLRLARRLRKRAERETSRRADLAGAHGRSGAAASPWIQAMSADQKEDPMPQLVKRTVTVEEYLEEEKTDLESVEEDDEDASEDDEKAEPAAAARRR